MANMSVAPIQVINVQVNGVKYSISNTSPNTSLNEWLRSQPCLKGTKVTCQEGGCGSCIVALTKQDLVTNKQKTIAVNSCLFPLFAADGFKITTTEGIGSSRNGFHAIQERIAEYNGSQCGYCTPGFVMNMYSLLSENSQPSKQEIEDGFDGNLCRCTGFRSILDAMKSFAKGESPIDIEDLSQRSSKGNCCEETKACHGCCFNMRELSSPLWYKPSSLSDVYNILKEHISDSVRLVGGNTGKGVYKNDGDFNVYISVTDIPELNIVKVTDSTLELGASLSLNTLIRELLQNSEKSKSFDVLASHIKKIANVAVRNVGCWAGNLMLLHKHREFPSDIFTITSAVGATLNIGSVDGSANIYTMEEFLSLGMQNKVIISIMVPFSRAGEVVKSFKIMPRHQNAHAYVNAGLRVLIDSSQTVRGVPSFVFGGIKNSPMRASATEQYLSEKNLWDFETLKGCLNLLNKEIVPESSLLKASMEYRKSLAVSLFYKLYLALLGDKANERFRSAAVPFVRPISSGQQSYDTTANDYPVTQPIPKMSAKLQASGEAQFTDDIPKRLGEVYGAFVTTAKGNCKIASIDPSEATNMPGVLKFITAKDIPGENNFVGAFNFDTKETIFCDEDVGYAGQGVGVIIAVSQSLADEAAEKVKITYTDCKPPIITIDDAVRAQSFISEKIVRNIYGDPDAFMAASAHVISGEIRLGTQHHLHMETHICLCIPGEEEMEVYSAAQFTDNTQKAVAQVLNMPQKSVHVTCRRCGGAFGGKAIREGVNSAACAVAAYVMNRPVRLRMNLKTNMTMVGKRFPYLAKYKVGVTDEGILNAVDITLYTGCGLAATEISITNMAAYIDNVYYCENWKFHGVPCKTNTATNAFTRAPRTMPAIFVTETMMNHVAKVLNKSPDEIRQINFYKQGQITYYKQPLEYCNISKIWQDLKESSEFDRRKREIAKFNKENRWRKRGISLVPLRYGITRAPGSRFTAYVAIFRKDGTVSISHAGIEMGQGINTKACQVAAYTLGHGLKVDQISVRPATSFMNPNGAASWASMTSELCCEAVANCCSALKKRIEPVAKDMPNSSTWVEIIEKCFEVGVDLSAKHMVFPRKSHQFNYNVYASTCTEVEIDVLTGETEILRTDILYDCGKSTNPEIDIGQVEGAFVMGLGYWLTENAIYEPTTGLQLNTGTWDYYPPFSKDIPIDFRVSLLKEASNHLGFLRSKAVGEPPLCMSCSCLFAVQDAIYHAREEIGKDKDYFALDGPATVEATQLKCLVDPEQFLF
ncbi:xanthine dehydrogenase-like [Dendronephthya gigantea]|uniref:xanthine dehydrogenase-like n=1 Tax=Dendronephthya gigantea TaxID=151771 RepID=UPI00106B1BB4|nr:xanthine dehydrogenase-like [Dendronephthya gigantea]